jgi:molybdenum cofactor biosynthesis enzyme MoaA
MNNIMQDKTKRAYSKRFHNIYLFITEKCQLRCGHCYMGERLERGLTMSYEQATNLIKYFHTLGAEYLTLVGGEPTLHPHLREIVEYANHIGYSKVMLDSNGLLTERIKKIPVEMLYYVRISLDGATPTTHDKVRGEGNFDKTIKAILELVDANYKVRVTSTVFNFNLHEGEEMLKLAEELRVDLVNFHTFSEEGNGILNKNWSLVPDEWIEFCRNMETLKGKYQVPFRYPPTWVKQEDLEKYTKQGYKGCIGCSLDRLSVFPDGRCYVCSLLFDTPTNFAFITENGLTLNKGENEYELFTKALLNSSDSAKTGCPAEQFLNQELKDNGYISVCRLWRTVNQ